jgi:multiple sugar transport system substrate-binding protein
VNSFDRGTDPRSTGSRQARRTEEEAGSMDRHVERQTEELANSYLARQMSRRTFVTRLLALGIAPSVVGAIVAACGASATTVPSVAPAPSTAASAAASLGPQPSPTPADLKGNIRFLLGPWSSGEVDHHKHIAQGFNAIYPNVTFDFRLYQWDTASQEINTSLTEGAHDIYMTTESSYPAYESGNGFTDLTSKITDPSFASELAKYQYMDRIKSYGPKILGLPISFHVEDAMFVNMDMVQAAGFDEHFIDTYPTFLDCVTKMTKKGQTYGMGIGIQLGGYAEWYQRLRAAGGSYLTPDLKAPNVNLPAVVEVTDQMASLFKLGIAPPLGTYTYDAAPAAFAAGKMAIYSSDLASTTALPAKVPFTWKLLPYPPGPVSQVNFNDLSIYMINTKTTDQNLAWEVLKWWTNGSSDAYWADNSGTYPARTDAATLGYGTNSAPQLAEALPAFQAHAVGLENFPQWGDVENLAEAEIQNCYAGKETAAQAVANVEKIVKQEVGI